MKKLCIFLFILIAIFGVSCKNETLPDVTPPPTFPAPFSVTVNTYVDGYGVYWSGVANSIDYQIYVRSDSVAHVSKIQDFNFYGENEYGISWTNFKKLTVYGAGPYQYGVQAVSINGIYSNITWSNKFNNVM